jgi:hypothetical protein
MRSVDYFSRFFRGEGSRIHKYKAVEFWRRGQKDRHDRSLDTFWRRESRHSTMYCSKRDYEIVVERMCDKEEK